MLILQNIRHFYFRTCKQDNGGHDDDIWMKEILRMEWRGMAMNVSGRSVAILTARCGCRCQMKWIWSMKLSNVVCAL